MTKGRALHLVDLENLAGGPRTGPAWLLETAHRYQHRMCPALGDLVVAACEKSLYKMVAFDLPRTWRSLPGIGPDGADQVLLAQAPHAWVIDRFDRLVIASGDHAFLPLACTVHDAGVKVTVTSRLTSLHRPLAERADTVVPIVVDLRHHTERSHTVATTS